ncbi:hypothetical protein EG832_02995, partial [bacterium]|nr:hypothetical protein [bacterium]
MANPMRRMNQYRATSYGSMPSAVQLDKIIQSELDAAADDERRNKELKLRQEAEQRERDRLEMEQDAAKSAQIKGVVGSATQIGTTAAGLIGKDKLMNYGKGIVESAQDIGRPAYNRIGEATGLWAPSVAKQTYNTGMPSLEMASANPEQIFPYMNYDTSVSIPGVKSPTIASNGIVQNVNNTSEALATPELMTVPSAAGKEIATVAGDTLATTTGDLATDAGIDTSASIIGESAANAGTSTLGTVGGVVASMAP